MSSKEFSCPKASKSVEECGWIVQNAHTTRAAQEALLSERAGKRALLVVPPSAFVNELPKPLQVDLHLGDVFFGNGARGQLELEMSGVALTVSAIFGERPLEDVLPNGQHGHHVLLLHQFHHGTEVLPLPA